MLTRRNDDAHSPQAHGELPPPLCAQAVQLLLDKNALPSWVDSKGDALLSAACLEGREDCVGPLLDAKASYAVPC